MGSKVQIDDRVVRVTRWTLKAQEATGPHRHAYDYVVVPISGGRMRIVQADGSQNTAELTPGQTYFREAGTEHNVLNAGEALLDFVEVELVRGQVGAG
jgi:quercetin dioxygenase-like cupin family protein